MRGHKKVFILFFVTTLFIVLSLWISYILAETFFFDKIFLNKSNLFGYDRKLPVWDLLDIDDPIPFLLARRISDTNDLVQLARNSQFQSKSINTPTDEGKFKVALIGDSFVYGMGVKMQDRIGVLLEKNLNKQRPSRVYSLGLSGDSLLDDYVKIELARKYIQADLYVIVMVENDTYLDYPNKYPGGEEIFDRISATCPGTLYSFDYSKAVTGDDVTNKVDYPSWSNAYTNHCILKKIVQEIQNKHADILYLSMIPKVDTCTSENQENETALHLDEVINAYSTAIVDAGGKVIYPDSSFIYEPVSKIEGHSSVKTNGTFAQIISEELKSNPVWKFAQ